MENNRVEALGKTTESSLGCHKNNVMSVCGLRAVPAVRIRKVPLPCNTRRMQQSWTCMP